VLAVGYMGKLISERSGGRHGIKVYGNSVLGSEKDTIEQVRIGALDMIRINVAPMNNVVPRPWCRRCRSCSVPPRTCARSWTARSATRS